MDLLKRIFPAGLLMFRECEEPVPQSDLEGDKLNFRDNLKLAMQHSHKNKKNVIGKPLEGIKHWGLSLIDHQEKVNQTLKNRSIVLRNRGQKKKNNEAMAADQVQFQQLLNSLLSTDNEQSMAGILAVSIPMLEFSKCSASGGGFAHICINAISFWKSGIAVFGFDKADVAEKLVKHYNRC